MADRLRWNTHVRGYSAIGAENIIRQIPFVTYVDSFHWIFSNDVEFSGFNLAPACRATPTKTFSWRVMKKVAVNKASLSSFEH